MYPGAVQLVAFSLPYPECNNIILFWWLQLYCCTVPSASSPLKPIWPHACAADHTLSNTTQIKIIMWSWIMQARYLIKNKNKCYFFKARQTSIADHMSSGKHWYWFIFWANCFCRYAHALFVWGCNSVVWRGLMRHVSHVCLVMWGS